MAPTAIRNTVRAERVARGISQSQLGEAIGLTRQTVAAIEREAYAPSLEAAFRIANHFEMTIEQLFFWRG